MKTVCVYHSIDLDGWMSAAIVKYWFEKQLIITNSSIDSITDKIDFIGYNYGQPIPDLSEYDKVIMCDISFPIEEMENLRQHLQDNFIWIDHHISAIKAADERTNNYYDGIRDTKFAACELTWKYFFPDEPMPEIVRLLGRYDCFGHKGTDEEQKVLEFQYGARQCISNYEEAYTYLSKHIEAEKGAMLSQEVSIPGIWNKGKAIYQYLCTEAKQTYKNGFEIIFNPLVNKVFLGGTCNNSIWRDELIPLLNINYFNPVVEDWTPECQLNEYKEKELSNIHLYVITKEMTGVFSIAEVIDSVHSNKETVFIVIPNGFNNRQLKSLQAVADMVVNHGGKAKITSNMKEIAIMINRLDDNLINKSYKFICINKERFNPINFGIDYHKDGYDGCACFHYDGKQWCFSLYNDNGLVDCSQIAQHFGGGGHKGAAGFKVDDINKFLNI